MAFFGIDHIDLRVPALGAVEAFYDKFFTRLGLTRKKYSVVTFGGESWNDGTPEQLQRRRVVRGARARAPRARSSA